MNDPGIFDVNVYQRIPYVTRGLFILMALLIVFEVVGLIPLFSSKHFTDEVRLLYFIVLYPDNLTFALMVGAVLLAAIWPLYIYLRLNKSATLTIDTTNFMLKGENYNKTIPVQTIRNINCFDPQTKAGLPKGKFIIVIQDRKNKRTRFLLKDYLQAEKLLDCFTLFEDIKLEVHANNYWDLTVMDE